MITECDTHDGCHSVEKEHSELKPIDSIFKKVDWHSCYRDQCGSNEEDTGNPVDSFERDFEHNSLKEIIDSMRYV